MNNVDIITNNYDKIDSFINYQISKFNFSAYNLDIEDIKQNTWFKVFVVFNDGKFDENRGASWETFITTVIRNFLKETYNKGMRNLENYNGNLISIDAPNEQMDETIANGVLEYNGIYTEFENFADSHSFEEVFKDVLTYKEIQVLKFMTKKYTYNEIAEEMGMNRGWDVQSIVIQLRRRINRDGLLNRHIRELISEVDYIDSEVMI